MTILENNIADINIQLVQLYHRPSSSPVCQKKGVSIACRVHFCLSLPVLVYLEEDYLFSLPAASSFIMAPTKGERKMLLPKGQRDSPETSCCSSLKMKIFCVSLVGVALSVVGLSVFAVSAYPLHASCRVEWTFGKSCSDVQAALINQMKIWETDENCGTGQKCLYTYLSSTPTTIKGLHTTPVKRYVDDISYTFTSGAGNTCNMQGYSSSQLWYAVLDYGTNYCNIKNLVDGANLEANDSQYSESTRDSVCTQYSSANCEKY